MFNSVYGRGGLGVLVNRALGSTLRLVFATLTLAASSAGQVDIGSTLELFVDERLIEKMDGARLVLHTPTPAGKVLDFDRPWEGVLSNCVDVFQDGATMKMYYRGARQEMEHAIPGSSNVCYAESKDGIHWTRPHLGLYDFKGSTENNIVYMGPGTPGWFCFKDENPEAPPEQRYKALCKSALGYGGPLAAMVSPDGLHWKRLRQEPIITGGPLDTLNIARWDPVHRKYLAFVRNFVTQEDGFSIPPNVDAPSEQYHRWWKERSKARSIAVLSSTDFVNWTRQQWIFAPGTPIEHLYTNAAIPYFRAPQLWLGFPMRYFPDRSVVSGWAGSTLAANTGCSDAAFISSRDGLHWDRTFMEAFLRPGLEESNWTDRNMIIGPGILQTGPGEISLYYVSHYGHPDSRLERVTLRLDGFASVNAGYGGGSLVTRPMVFAGRALVINYSTSAAGSIAAEIQDLTGKALPGFALQDCPLMIGDQIARPVKWTGGSDVSALAGRPVRLRFVLKDADLYSLQFKP